MENKKKYALITGASSGIGYELAKLFAKDQYNLVMVARHQEELNQRASELKKDYGIEIMPLAKDLMKRKDSFEVYQEVKNAGIQIDVLVNNAGQGEYGKFVETDLEKELDILQLNIGAYLVLTKSFLKEMIARNDGKILLVTSIAGEIPGPLQAVYHGTKAFLNSFSVALREEIRDSNVTVTNLLPGPTDTDFFEKAGMEESKIVQEGKLADPAKVAKDGYEAVMSGEHERISGFKNKATVAASQLMPDRLAAKGMRKQSEPVNKDKKES